MRNQTEIDDFLDYGATEEAWSIHTRSAYARDLALYLEFLGPKGLAATSADRIRDFLAERARQGDADRSLARRLATLRSFHRYLLAEGFVQEDLRSQLDPLRRPRNLPHFLSAEEMEELLVNPRGPAPLAIRDRALLELLYATGIRVSELVGLRPVDLEAPHPGREAGSLRVRGKGDKERVVPLHARARAAIDEWLRLGRPALLRPHSPDELFLSVRGHALTRDGVFRRLQELGRRAGIRQSVTPHLLRHTFATHLIHGGADLRIVQELLGHASPETTTIYTSVDAERLRSLHRKCHPRG